ncbi:MULTISPECIES: hypothetical protein [Spirosoma]|uniref:hypothetical protein n=1 Tax=Spirosoma TaxID=107 RepID=UPI00137479EE|nr:MULTISPECIES: hypothetical protein [Spirosoma]
MNKTAKDTNFRELCYQWRTGLNSPVCPYGSNRQARPVRNKLVTNGSCSERAYTQ